MSNQIEFKYFPDYMKFARFVEDPCDNCSSNICLNGAYFEDAEVPDSVCLDLLVSGKYRVYIPDYLKEDLENSVRATYPTWTEEEIRRHIEVIVDELSRTPPVPWIQNNNWPVHHGDFCRYIGEWDQVMLTKESQNGDGLSYLMSILADPEDIGDIQSLWESIGNGWTVVFVFECLLCNQRIAIEQSY